MGIENEFTTNPYSFDIVRTRIISSLSESAQLIDIVGFPDAKSAEESVLKQQARSSQKSSSESSTAPFFIERSRDMICSLSSDEFGEIRWPLEPGQYVFEVTATNYFGRSIPPFLVMPNMSIDKVIDEDLTSSKLGRANICRCSVFLHPVLHNVRIVLKQENGGQRLRYENIAIAITNAKNGQTHHHRAITDDGGIASVRIPTGHYECKALIPDFMTNQQM